MKLNKKEKDQFFQMQSKNNVSAILRLFLCTFILSAALPGSALSDVPSAAGTPCDPHFWSTMKSRAWLEAQRELTQNQNLIFKPDSVFEYTCFKGFLDLMAGEGSNMFNETEHWDNSSLNDPSSPDPALAFDKSLEDLVNEDLRGWLYSNFGYTRGHPDYFALLGGRLNADAPTFGSGIDYLDPLDNPVGSGNYTCSIMQNVWEEAKCMNFVDVPDEDNFFSFQDYVGSDDKRFLPKRCDNINKRWQNNLENFIQDPKSTKNTTEWIEDDVILFTELLDPANCQKTRIKVGDYKKRLQPFIETGVFVKDKNFPNGYEQKICTPPGCYYEPKGRTRGQCKPNPKIFRP